MPKDVLEKILTNILHVYMSYDDSVIEELLVDPNLIIKERVAKIGNVEVIIYTNDHNPPHFHVKTNDNNINAKFLIETGEYISGEINSKNLKRIRAYYNSPKTKSIMEIVWNKKVLK